MTNLAHPVFKRISDLLKCPKVLSIITLTVNEFVDEIGVFWVNAESKCKEFGTPIKLWSHQVCKECTKLSSISISFANSRSSLS